MTRTGFPLCLLTILCAAIGLAICDAQDLCAQQTGIAQATGVTQEPLGDGTAARSLPLGTIDSDTRWAFRTVSPVSVSSPIVRLGDVVQPLNPNTAGWQRLRRSPIGLLPLGSQPMTIQRNRLERVMLDAEATPLAIDWIGPEKIEVRYVESAPKAVVARVADETTSVVVTQASHQTGVPDAELTSSSSVNRVSEMDIDRIAHWVRLALDRLHPDVSKNYRVEIPIDQPELSSLAAIVGVTDISPIDPVGQGDGRFRLTARSSNGPLESNLRLTLTPHPMVAVPCKQLPKGHLITSRDLEMQPIPEDQLESDHVLDPADVVGLEVRGFPRPGRPLNRSDLGSPTLVRRGDLIEVRVMGGGVIVTTNAKAHGDGAASELIEVETLEPRKRLLARVVQPGLVEIVTRAPRVQP